MVDRIVDRIIGYAGKLLIHVVRTLLVCWQRMLRLGVSVGVLGGAVAVVFGAVVTHSIPPTPLIWVAGMCFGFVVGYAAAMTVLADELLLGMVETIGVLEGDIKAGLRAATVAAEREAGDAGRGIMRFLGHARTPTPDTPPARGKRRQPQGPPSSQLPALPPEAGPTLSTVERRRPKLSQADETLAAIAATERFLNTAPRPRPNARPVRADQLPRIEWASEEAEKRSARPAPAPVAMPLAEMPPLPVRTLRNPALVEATMTAAPAPALPADQPVWTAPAQPDDAPDARVATEPTAVRDDASAAGTDQRDDTPSAADDEIPSAAARPLATVSPPVETGQPERGIWARIGQALIGNTTRPLQDAERVSNQNDESGSEEEQS